MNEPITTALLEKLLKEGFTTLIASGREGHDLIYRPSKEPVRNALMDDASVTGLSEKELLGIDEVLNNFTYYEKKGLEIELAEDK